MTTDRPASANCPRWCRSSHPANPLDVGDDHSTVPVWIPATVLHRAIAAGQRRFHPGSAELVVALTQPVDSPEPWIYMSAAEDTSTQMELSIGTARRLLWAIEDQLRCLGRENEPLL